MTHTASRRTCQEELAAYLKTHPDTKTIDGVIFDLCGRPLGKRYPIEDAGKLIADGMAICAAVMLLDVTGNTSDPLGYGVSDGDPDALAFALPGTIAPIPWSREPAAQILMALHRPETGEPVFFEPRHILSQVAHRFRDLALTPVVAVELEFYILAKDRAADGGPLPVASPFSGRPVSTKQVYSLAALDEFAPLLDAITAACAAQNVPVSVASTEFSPGQFELNLRHVTDPVLAADHACLLRRAVLSVLRNMDVDGSFASKPFPDQSGSGLHIHVSLQDSAGANIFDDAQDPEETRLKQAIAGLQAAMPESMAFFAPNMNAFRRFEPGSFVPVTRDWGYDNRAAAFRIPSGRGAAKRIEHRVAGAEANPYLTLACVLAGIHHGLTNGLEPLGPAHPGNAGENADPAIPLTPWQALDRLDNAPILADYLGSDYLSMYQTVKRNELMDLLSAPFPREYDWYL